MVAKSQFSVYDLERKVKLPIKCPELAEFMGILFGDGYALNKGRIHRIEITLNSSEDIHYKEYVCNLIKKLFNLNPKVRIRKQYHRIDIIINSMGMANFVNDLGIPTGRKKNRLKLPKWVSRNSLFLRYFLRGLVDTDGSLFFTKRGTYKLNKYPVIEMKLHDRNFISELANALKKLGFACVRTKFKVQLNGIKNLEKWVEEIGFKNMNLISRYLIWKRFNYCPPKTDLRKRLNMLARVAESGHADQIVEQNRLQI